MSSMNVTRSHYVDHDVFCHFQDKLEKDKILNIYLTIRKENNGWQVQARTSIEYKGKLVKEINQDFTVKSGASRWLGSWHWNFLKPACLNMAGKVEMLEEIHSKPDNITPEELGYLRSEKLVEISGFDDDFMIKSDFLKEISETPIDKEQTDIKPENDVSGNSNIKPDEEAKENHIL